MKRHVQDLTLNLISITP